MGLAMKYLSVLLLVAYFSSLYAEEEDYYKLLGVPRDADNRSIRKAFKQLAVKMHPDKNADDPDAQAKFIKVSRAYEVLKDPNMRKHYDLYGDVKDGDTNRKHTFHSYSYYQNEFGLYDDDPNIITLGLSDFESNVNDPNIAWFINFYSPQCSHCHDLAPTWRKLASELEGVIRIAAVNCEEDWQLCTQLQIHGYPTLMFYSKDAHMFEGEKYVNNREVKDLQNFVLDRLDIQISELEFSDWNHEKTRKQPWLLFLCGNTEGLCPEEDTILKLAAMLDGLMKVSKVQDPELCKEISSDYLSIPIIFWQAEDTNDIIETKESASKAPVVHQLYGSDAHELAKQILELLPGPQSLNQEMFRDVRTRLRLGDSKAWLICFSLGAATELSVQLKRLPAFLPHMNIGIVHCAQSADLCASLHISRYPVWGVLKEGGAFEMHHGKDTLHDVAAFARDSSFATNLHALSPADFNNIVKEGSTWFIDWYAPWCPPCQRLMPELRRASHNFEAEVIKFGTVDCTLHSSLCSQQGIRAYPTTVLYNASKTHYFHGKLNEDGIVEFVQDILNPVVISLNMETFKKHLIYKPKDEIWLVDYFASWCGPCQKLGPHWRQLAKEVAHLNQVRIAQVDCEVEPDLCLSQNVRSYPTIRLYPLGSEGLNTVAMYNGHRDSTSLKRWLLGFLPSPVMELNMDEFQKEVGNGREPWLIDFYAPWCGHCHRFDPDFTTVAQRLEGTVRSGKINCEAQRNLCDQQHVHSYPTVMLYISPTLRYEIDSQNFNYIIDRVKTLLSQLKHQNHDEL